MDVCQRHGAETRVHCPDCETPICPRCMVDTPVGVKCPACSAPAPELLARQRAITVRAMGIAVALGAGGAVVFFLLSFGFLMGLLVGYVFTEVLRRKGSAGNLLASGFLAAGTAWLGAAFLETLNGFTAIGGLQIHAFEGLIAAAVVWWRLR